ncbi:MAG: hypothetical protein HZA77_03055 [Candidatus Schekmanbacteria bacterium]|nr:hypothetical protein [Candidatus Schekmanbacteria bacterium]
MNSFGFILSFLFLVLGISVIWGILSFNGEKEDKPEALKSGAYIFSGLVGVSILLAIVISVLTV